MERGTGLMGEPPFHWLRVGEREIDSRVIRYPYPGATMAKRRNARGIGMLEW